MSNSKPIPPFTFDVLYYLNRDQLERFSIVCRDLKNFIERYFHSTPYRTFDRLEIRAGGSYALANSYWLDKVTNRPIYWSPRYEQADYSTHKFLDSRICGYDEFTKSWDISTRFWRYDSGHPIYNERAYYTFAKIRPYLGPTVRPKHTIIYIAGDSTYYPKQIEEMESISYLWRDGRINIFNTDNFGNRIGGKTELEDFQPVFNSPTLLQCRHLCMDNAHFSFKDCKVLYTVKFIQMIYHGEDIDLSYWVEFFEQPRVKPVVIFRQLRRESLANVLDQFSMSFSSSILPNAFKIVFAQQCDEEELTIFRKTNNTSGEILELEGSIAMGK
ncbi:hypothetical protein Ddc_18291 [Ditylenchus destructor]|nr:hypothetical protein Ddc_18291 [Ditylenchus destructor]